MTIRELFNNSTNGLKHIEYLLKVFKKDARFENFFLENKGTELQEEQLGDIKFYYNDNNLVLEYPKKLIKYFPLGLAKANWEEKDGMLILSDDKEALVYGLKEHKVAIDTLFNKKW